jgi:hypothetical protein
VGSWVPGLAFKVTAPTTIDTFRYFINCSVVLFWPNPVDAELVPLLLKVAASTRIDIFDIYQSGRLAFSGGFRCKLTVETVWLCLQDTATKATSSAASAH